MPDAYPYSVAKMQLNRVLDSLKFALLVSVGPYKYIFSCNVILCNVI